MSGPSLLDLPIGEAPIAVLDLEMTGLDPLQDEICEVGVVRMRGGVIEQRFESLVRPAVPMSLGAREVHGIRDVDLAVAPTFDQVLDEVEGLLAGAVLVAHHVSFDLGFLDAAFGRRGRTLSVGPRLDTLDLSRRALALRSHRLGAVCEALAVPRGESHRALGDALATAGVFERLCGLLDPSGERTVEQWLQLATELERGSALRQAQEAALQRSMEARCSVWFDYLSPSEHGFVRARREVEVWAIKAPRFQGWCHLRGAERVFRLERVHAIQPGERPYRIPSFSARL